MDLPSHAWSTWYDPEVHIHEITGFVDESSTLITGWWGRGIHSKLAGSVKQAGVTDTPEGQSSASWRSGQAGEMSWQKPHEVQQELLSPAVGEEQPQALSPAGDWAAEKQLCRKGHGGIGGHQVDHTLASDMQSSRLREVILLLYPLIMPYWKYYVQIWAPCDKTNSYTLICNNCLHTCIFHLKRKKTFHVY